MAKRKVKRKPKKLLIVLIVLFVAIILSVGAYFIFFNKEEVKEAKVVSRIDEYGYNLKSNKSAAYKKLFAELKTVLSGKDVDNKKYVKLITKMFIVDFYSLNDRIAKTDVGGIDFVHEAALENFIVNAEDTFYKYVESNIYGQRDQKLPTVDKITIESVDQEEYSYNDIIDEDAYKVKASWTYKDEKIAEGYQNEATFIFVHQDKKLVLVEIIGDDSIESDEE